MNLHKIKYKKMNKRGSMIDFIIFGISAFAVLLTIGLIFFFNTKLDSALTQAAHTNPTINQSVKNVWEPYYNGLSHNVNFIAFGLIMGFIILILVTMFLVRLHPAFIIIYIIFWIIAIIFSVSLSNAFQSIENSALSSSFNAMPAALWIINNLVTVIVVLGIIGGILLFINAQVGEY